VGLFQNVDESYSMLLEQYPQLMNRLVQVLLYLSICIVIANRNLSIL